MSPSIRSCAIRRPYLLAAASVLLFAACDSASDEGDADDISRKLARYTTVRLTTETQLTDAERRMIPLLIEAAQAMDEVFWMQASGPRDSVLALAPDEDTRRYIEINYGPWDRLQGNEPFVEGVGPKPEGARFYPADITKEEFDAAVAEGGARADSLRSLYTLVRRDSAGRLFAVPYHEAFAEQHNLAAQKLREAAAIAEEPQLKRYLELRAEALLTGDYRASDLAWMDMKENGLDVIIGPIENYEDQLYGQKAAHETFVLVKDREWSQRLARYAQLLPALQRGLPVDDRYKQETPGSDSELNAYDAVYYAGDANAGSKTIAINLPNDEQVQLEKGTRRLQLKNSMRAKFDAILEPIADEVIDPSQRQHVQFDAFFANTMFHEVAHGLGIKNTLTGRGTVREALQEQASALEEEKADVLGLYMVSRLAEQGELGEVDIRDYYTTFVAGLFRSVRFGASSAHGRANLATFNFLERAGAFTRDGSSGRYTIDYDVMGEALNALAGRILTMQGDGDYEGVQAFMREHGEIGENLRADLDGLASKGIPVDIVFEQGVEVLGL
jgi:hypothetical protein